jgi:hypothetical protein
MPGLCAAQEHTDMMKVFKIQSELLQSLASFEKLLRRYGQPETKGSLPLNLDESKIESWELLEIETSKKESCKLLRDLWCGSSTILSQIADEQRRRAILLNIIFSYRSLGQS